MCGSIHAPAHNKWICRSNLLAEHGNLREPYVGGRSADLATVLAGPIQLRCALRLAYSYAADQRTQDHVPVHCILGFSVGSRNLVTLKGLSRRRPCDCPISWTAAVGGNAHKVHQSINRPGLQITPCILNWAVHLVCSEVHHVQTFPGLYHELVLQQPVLGWA
jgi:hypothetical protein